MAKRQIRVIFTGITGVEHDVATKSLIDHSSKALKLPKDDILSYKVEKFLPGGD